MVKPTGFSLYPLKTSEIAKYVYIEKYHLGMVFKLYFFACSESPFEIFTALIKATSDPISQTF